MVDNLIIERDCKNGKHWLNEKEHEQLLHGPSNAEMALTLAQFQGAI